MIKLGKQIVGATVGIAGLAAIVTLGPVDLMRTGYNLLIGDIPSLKTELVTYVRRDIQRQYPNASIDQLDFHLAKTFSVPFDGRTFNTQDVSIVTLWDAAEDHTYDLLPSVWTHLGR